MLSTSPEPMIATVVAGISRRANGLRLAVSSMLSGLGVFAICRIIINAFGSGVVHALRCLNANAAECFVR